MIVYLPNEFNRDSMYVLIDEVIDKYKYPKGKEITFNFCKLTFIDPVGVAILSNLIEWLNKEGCKVSFGIPKEYNDAIRYLDDSQFFKKYLGKKINNTSSLRDTTIPLETIDYKLSAQWIQKTIQWLALKIGVLPESLVNIDICLKEIFNNITDHSNVQIGCVFIQYYPKIYKVRMAISDFGVGIPYNIKKVFPEINDGEALMQAIEQGFTTKTKPNNGGAGLDILIHNVVMNHHGIVYIHSNHGILKSSFVNNEINSITHEIESYYPGTLIEVVFRTDNIYNYDVKEEFEWF